MKPQPFNLDLWLYLGKPDCVWTRNKDRVLELYHHENADQRGYCLSGLIELGERGGGLLYFWNSDGEIQPNGGQFNASDLMLHLEDKPKAFGVKTK